MSREAKSAGAGRPSEHAAGACVAALFEEHARMVYGVCRILLHEREDAEDATQQTFLSAYRAVLGGTEPREPAAWLAAIARNECRARLRARSAAPLALVQDAVEVPDDTDGETRRRADLSALVAALAELPGHQREAIVLREFYGLSHDEVAHALGVTPSAVDSLLVRARRRLQAELRPARLASGALVVPLALRESLAQALPGFASGSGGTVAKALSLPFAAKLASAAATVAVVGVVGGSAPLRHDLPLQPEARAQSQSRAPQAAAEEDGRRAHEVRVTVTAPPREDEARGDDGERPGRSAAGREREDDDRDGERRESRRSDDDERREPAEEREPDEDDEDDEEDDDSSDGPDSDGEDEPDEDDGED